MRSVMFPRLLAAMVSAVATVGALLPVGSPGLGQEPPSAPPGVADLLTSPPFDRITLTDGTVLIVDPISPRPLPPIDPAKTKKKNDTFRFKGSKTDIPIAGNISLPGETSKVRPQADEQAEENPQDETQRTVKLHLLQDVEVRDYSVKRANIRSIEYFEDILLDEGQDTSTHHWWPHDEVTEVHQAP